MHTVQLLNGLGALKHQEELRTACITRRLLRHAQRPGKMASRLWSGALTSDVVARSSGAITFGVTGLCHKSFEHAMKIDIVVEFFGCEVDKVGDGIGSLVLKQLDDDVPLSCRDFDLRKIIGQCFSLPNEELFKRLLGGDR